ncbi:MAG: hypothetical protein J3R72DRAFT_462031 [Linnemannia gamsii]|nr:MAG: hypothetical protein J3R72DRAFT_462031 [Linnemannia gamsii]
MLFLRSVVSLLLFVGFVHSSACFSCRNRQGSLRYGIEAYCNGELETKEDCDSNGCKTCYSTSTTPYGGSIEDWCLKGDTDQTKYHLETVYNCHGGDGSNRN